MRGQPQRKQVVMQDCCCHLRFVLSYSLAWPLVVVQISSAHPLWEQLGLKLTSVTTRRLLSSLIAGEIAALCCKGRKSSHLIADQHKPDAGTVLDSYISIRQ